MKKKVLIGIALVLVVGLLASCKSTPTVTTTTATVTTTATATKPVTTTATATVTTTQTTTATARTTTTATVTSTVTVTPTGGGTVTPPTLSFAAATYTDSTYNFTFQYDKAWTATWNTATNIVSFGDATYYDPSIRIFRFPKSLGATLADVLKSPDIMKDINTANPVKDPVIGDTKDNVKNVYGTTVTRIVHQYTSTTPSTSYCISYGFLKGDYWFIMLATQDSGWGITSLDPKKPDEMFSTWQFK